MGQLQYLDVSYNKISDGWDNFLACRKLKYLYVNNNLFEWDQDDFNDVSIRFNIWKKGIFSKVSNIWMLSNIILFHDRWSTEHSNSFHRVFSSCMIWNISWISTCRKIRSSRKFDNTASGSSPTVQPFAYVYRTFSRKKNFLKLTFRVRIDYLCMLLM